MTLYAFAEAFRSTMLAIHNEWAARLMSYRMMSHGSFIEVLGGVVQPLFIDYDSHWEV